MKRLRMKRWVKVVITIVIIHLSFFIWKQTGWLGELAQKNSIYMILCILSWIYLTIGQVLIYGTLWEK